MKGYTLEVIDKETNEIGCYDFDSLDQLNATRERYHSEDFCIVKQWELSDDELDYNETEITRYNF